MVTVNIGAATVTRIEETYEPNFDAAKFFPDWQPEVVDEHRHWMVPDHYDADTAFIKLSVHSWLIKIGGRTILIDPYLAPKHSLPSFTGRSPNPMVELPVAIERILEAIENPHVSVVAHPTGRLINRREAYDVDLDAVMAAAKKHGKLLELNANPARLDLNDVYCAAARQHGIPIAINTDAHSPDGLDVLRFGVLQARRAGLTKADIANTRPWPQLKKLIGGT